MDPTKFADKLYTQVATKILIQAHMLEIAKIFVPGVRIAFMAYHEDTPVLIIADDGKDVLIKVLKNVPKDLQ